jgi:predicted phosphodiesterase
MFALISDIHSNIEALTTVLADIESRGIKTIYCLGDVIGYGANPRECLDLVIGKSKWCVLGNHDYATLYEPTNFNYGAEQASFWTRFNLEDEPEKQPRDNRWEFLGKLPMRRTLKAKLGGVAATIDFLHASPRRPINEYIFPDDVYTNPVKVRVMFERVKHVCFVGHTHLPGVFLDEPDFYLPTELGSYVYVEENEVHFVRLEYDYKTAAEKIRSTSQLDTFNADRLEEGR